MTHFTDLACHNTFITFIDSQINGPKTMRVSSHLLHLNVVSLTSLER